MRRLLVLAAILALAAVLALVLRHEPPAPAEVAAAGPQPGASPDVATGAAATPAPAPEAAERLAIGAATPDETAGIVVRCVWADDRAPVRGLDVICYRLREAKLDPGPLGEATTDDRGVAHFAVGNGSYQLSAGESDARVEVADRQVEIELAIEAKVHVTGRVVDEQGRPIDRAAIEFADLRAMPHAVTESAADGTFAFRGRSVGEVWSRKTGFVPSDAARVDKSGRPVELVMRPGGHAIRGVVVDPGGTPVARALVVVATFLDDAEKVATPIVEHTDGDGEFVAVGVPDGPCVIYAKGSAWTGAVTEARAPAAAPVVVRLRVGATVRGTIAARDGTVRAHVGVQAHREHRLPGLSEPLSSHFTYAMGLGDAEGRFELRAVWPGRMWLSAFVTPTKMENALLRDGETFVWNPIDGPAGTRSIRCVLTAGDGRALVGWRVATRRVEASTAQLETASATSDDGGRIELKDLRDLPYDLTLMAPGSDWTPFAVRNGVPAGGAEFVWSVPFALADCGALAGRVLGADGRPVAGLRVRAERDGVKRTAGAGADGAVRFDRLPPGPWQLHVSGNGYGSARLGTWIVDAGAEVDAGELRLPQPGRVVVRVDGPATATAGVHFDLREVDGSNRTGDFAASNGALASAPVPPGRYRLTATGPALAPSQQVVDVAPGADTAVAIAAEPCVPVVVAFEPEEQFEPRWRDFVDVELRDAAGAVVWHATATVDTSGPYRWSIGLRPGRHSITGESFTLVRRRGTAEFAVPEATTTPIEVRVQLALQ